MAEDKSLNKIKIDGKEYELANLSDEAKAQLTNLQFVDAQIQQLNNELAISDTARIGYTGALKKELAKLNSK
jgi:ribosomal protein L29